MSPVERLRAAPRCRARAKRTGEPCRNPAVAGRPVCRHHGGAGRRVRGAEHGMFRHGLRTQEADEARRQRRELLRQARQVLEET